jgi:hypothetical protein
MFTQVIKHRGFWKSVIFLALMFMVIYNIADVFMVFEGSFSSYVSERFASENLLKFFAANISSGFVYGFIVSFFKFRGKIKKDSKKA